MYIGIIGAGIIGNRLAQSFEKHPDIEIKRVCDLDIDRAKILAEKYNAEYTDNIDDILGEDIDIVYIGVPPKYHSQLAIKVMNAGKHVIVEKPIALSVSEADDMIISRDKADVITAINLPFRFEPGIIQMKKEIENGLIGDIRLIELRFRFPNWPRKWQDTEWLKTSEQGGALREVGTHYFFALNEIFGEVDEVTAITNYPDEKSCETQSTAILRLKNGLNCTMTMLTGTDEEMQNTLIVYGNHGILYHYMWHRLVLVKNGVEKELRAERFSSEYAMTENFIRAINGDEKSKSKLVTFEDARAAQKTLESILCKK